MIVQGATVGCRYWRLYTLAQYARKCHVSFEELHTDGMQIGELFKSIDDGASLSDVEIQKALYEGYLERLSPKSAIDFINEKAQLNIQKNRRNGLKQEYHLEDMRQKKINMKRRGLDFKNPEGRPTKENIVAAWRAANPDGSKADCCRETGLTKPTVYKWWDSQ